MKLLVVEDDPALRMGLLRLLGQWGYGAEAAGNGAEAEAWLDGHSFDLLLLDLGLPDGDGLRLVERLRRRAGPQPLVLVLSARDGRLDKLRSLDGGADDYVVKPFDPELLRAHIRALLRRVDRPLSSELQWGPLRLQPGQTTVWLGGHALELTRKEALLLELLVAARGQCRSKAQLLHGCGDGRREVGEETIRTHMRNLRQKLARAGGGPDLIETVHGLGYRLNSLPAA